MSGIRDPKFISAGENDDNRLPTTPTEVEVATSSTGAFGARQSTSGATTDETTTEIDDDQYPVYLNTSGTVFVQDVPNKLSFTLPPQQMVPPNVTWVVLSGSERIPKEMAVGVEPHAELDQGGESTSSSDAGT